eukprot:3643539-Alexandrium_andersonii.AAC.1
MFACLGAGAALARGCGAGTPWPARGVTCSWPPSELLDPARHAQGTARRFWSSSQLQRSARGRRATARTSRASVGLTAKSAGRPRCRTPRGGSSCGPFPPAAP